MEESVPIRISVLDENDEVDDAYYDGNICVYVHGGFLTIYYNEFVN